MSSSTVPPRVIAPVLSVNKVANDFDLLKKALITGFYFLSINLCVVGLYTFLIGNLFKILSVFVARLIVEEHYIAGKPELVVDSRGLKSITDLFFFIFLYQSWVEFYAFGAALNFSFD